MNNIDISRLLFEIAELLELKEVSAFEVTAYKNAGQTIENGSINIIELYKSKGIEGLQDIDGIGKTIAKNISEYIETKKSSKLTSLEKEIPKIKLLINKIPTIGPKKTLLLHRILEPKNYRDFIKKVKSEKYKNILEEHSIKEKTIQNILSGIKFATRQKKKISYQKAKKVANYFIESLKSNKYIKNIEFAGSLRRKNSFVGDLDIVASCNQIVDASNITEQFCKNKQVKKIITQGDKKASIISRNNIQVDLEVVESENFGNLLQHFTGSKEHNVKLRRYALSKGFSVSENGIKVDNRVIKCPNEECVYKTLGLKYIPPEERMGLDEIEKAKLKR